MPTVVTAPEINSTIRNASPQSRPLLISLAPLSRDSLDRTLGNLATAFPNENLLIATPDTVAPSEYAARLTLLHYASSAPSLNGWTLTASDFLNAYKLMQENDATTCLLLGPEAQSLTIEAIRALAEALTTKSTNVDIAIPRYELGPIDGLVNSAILYPLTRGLYHTQPRFPLAVDVALSLRMAEHLAAATQRFTAINQNEAILWPITEAVIANCNIAEVPGGPRILPAPAAVDLNTLFTQVVGSFFADIDAKASFWQRIRVYTNGHLDTPQETLHHTPEPETVNSIVSMLDSFHLAYTNLHEIWALVLPPNSLLGLKKLSLLSAASFRLPDPLWVRIIYDFVLAYRLRSLNRNHLLGALTPLYLAWVASHLNQTMDGSITPEQHIQQLATAFETDKPYLVSRWRWPDRFNP